MPKWLKTALKILGVLFCLLLVLWMAVAAYVYSNKKELLQTITTQLSEDLRGTLTIGSMEPSLIRGFPGISVGLRDVLLRDSTWTTHRHDLVKADRVFIAINAFSILGGNPTIKDIRLENGSVYLFTDSSGVRNTDIFKRGADADSSRERKTGRINRVLLRNVALTIDDRQKGKLFKFDVNSFNGSIKYRSGGWKASVKADALVHSFAFNEKKGSFIKNRRLRTNLDLSYDKREHKLDIPLQDLTLGDDDFEIGGMFDLSDTIPEFRLDVKTNGILYQSATSLLPRSIRSKLTGYNLEKPLGAAARIEGPLRGGKGVLINVAWNVKNNTLIIGKERISDVSFTGSFSNEWIAGGPRTDPNSVIRFKNMTGRYFDIPFTADSIRISDLREPTFTGRFKSNFPLVRLNDVLGSQTFVFKSGEADLDLDYKAPFHRTSAGQRFIYGSIQVRAANAEYLPRKLPLNGMNLSMNFKGSDLFIENIRLKSGSSSVSMKGEVRNFANLYYSDPAKMLVRWQVNSPNVNLSEFMAFAGRRSGGTKKSGSSIAQRLDEILDKASMDLRLDVGAVSYRKFRATQVHGELSLTQSGVAVNDVNLRHGGGIIRLSGDLKQRGKNGTVTVRSNIRNVDVRQLFQAFNNFGQDAITADNLRGRFNGSTDVTALMRDNGDIVPGSFNGTVKFDLQNGALVNFDPMMRLGKFAFANRNFSDIRFSSLKNTLTLRGNKVNIPPMEIRSSVLNVYLDGVYSFTTGTDIAIRIPLRNPEKDVRLTNRRLREERDMRGIVVNLRAVDGDDGRVKFRLGKRGS